MSETDGANHVVTAFLRNRGEVLLLKRSDAVGTYPGRWGGVSGYAEDEPDEQVLVEIREETGLDPETDVTLVRSGRPVEFADPELDREWVVHPSLFDCESRAKRESRDERAASNRGERAARPEIELSEEHVECAWTPPTAIATGEYETVPKLWDAYERVAPTVRSIAADDEHGAASLSIRALEVLRDRAGLLVREREGEGENESEGEGDEPDRVAEWGELADLAGRLFEARPAMAVVRNRVNRAMADAEDGDGTRDAETALRSTIAAVERAVEADEAAAQRAGEFASGRVLTLSRSGTVLEALRAGEPNRVFVAESRPAREGVEVAEALARDVPVTLHTDAATAHLLSAEKIDAVLVGADAVLPDGRAVNKVGTRAAAIAAAREDVPVYAVAAIDKVSTREAVNLESGDRSAVYEGEAPLDVANPTFDVTPADCVTGIVTERGVLDAEGVAAVAAELRELEGWDDVRSNS